MWPGRARSAGGTVHEDRIRFPCVPVSCADVLGRAYASWLGWLRH